LSVDPHGAHAAVVTENANLVDEPLTHLHAPRAHDAARVTALRHGLRLFERNAALRGKQLVALRRRQRLVGSNATTAAAAVIMPVNRARLIIVGKRLLIVVVTAWDEASVLVKEAFA
jgi:hypothetical protein